MTSRGPAIYRSERIGVGGEPFDMLKLRTMVDGADKRHELISGTHEGAGPLFKLHEDPRVTPVGAFLRRYSIDELPQLINVLKGDMSIVGPRPPLRREVEHDKPPASGQAGNHWPLAGERSVQFDLGRSR
jgi:lipopolysaccharide/colanic/teichoic acid biosynthesis glycosyltransferase